jgi:hypothetical protein
LELRFTISVTLLETYSTSFLDIAREQTKLTAYLTGLPAAHTPLFANRHFMFPSGISLPDIVTTNLGSFDEKLTSSSSSSSHITDGWNCKASASYLWFSVSADAASQTAIKNDFEKYTKY